MTPHAAAAAAAAVYFFEMQKAAVAAAAAGGGSGGGPLSIVALSRNAPPGLVQQTQSPPPQPQQAQLGPKELRQGYGISVLGDGTAPVAPVAEGTWSPRSEFPPESEVAAEAIGGCNGASELEAGAAALAEVTVTVTATQQPPGFSAVADRPMGQYGGGTAAMNGSSIGSGDGDGDGGDDFICVSAVRPCPAFEQQVQPGTNQPQNSNHQRSNCFHNGHERMNGHRPQLSNCEAGEKQLQPQQPGLLPCNHSNIQSYDKPSHPSVEHVAAAAHPVAVVQHLAPPDGAALAVNSMSGVPSLALALVGQHESGSRMTGSAEDGGGDGGGGGHQIANEASETAAANCDGGGRGAGDGGGGAPCKRVWSEAESRALGEYDSTIWDGHAGVQDSSVPPKNVV